MMSMFAWMIFKLHMSVAQLHAPPQPPKPIPMDLVAP
jgi:hypothetical protein